MSILRENLNHLLSGQADLGDTLSEDPTLSELELICEKTGYDLITLFQYNINALRLPWSDIKFIFLDVDGVLTEGGMFYTEEGAEFKRFDTKDGSRNQWFMAWMTFGDGWHNNHHQHPRAASSQVAWWEFDLNGQIIYAWEKMGLVWNVRRAPKYRRDADGKWLISLCIRP